MNCRAPLLLCACASGVVALTQSFDALIGPYLPIWVETMLLPFREKIIYDGIISSYNPSFGGGIRNVLNEDYKQAKLRLDVVTTLSNASNPSPTADPTKKRQTKFRPAKSAIRRPIPRTRTTRK